jgi:HSP20 family protein
MAENLLVREPRFGKTEPVRSPFDAPFFRGNLFALNPFTLMRRFTDEMDHFFKPSGELAATPNAWIPVVEVKEKDNKLIVTAELPGLKKEDVKVYVEGDALILEGERKKETEEKGADFYHSERSYGAFYRSIPLPEGIKLDAISANFTNGVLEAVIPVAEVKTKRKDVPVNEPPKVKAAA